MDMFQTMRFLMSRIWMFVFTINLVGSDPEPTLRIGMVVKHKRLPPHLDSDGELAKSLANKKINRQIEVILIAYPSAATQLDRANETYTKMSSLQLHAVIGPKRSDIAMAAEKLGIVHLCTGMDNGHMGDVTLHMLPNPKELIQPILDIIAAYEWKEFAVFYQETIESNLIAALVQGTHVNIKLRGLPVTMPDAEVRSVLLEMRNLHTRRFLMLLSTTGGRKLLTLARRLGMTAKPNSWIMLNLGYSDMVTGILDDLSVNMTTVSLVTQETLDEIDGLGSEVGDHLTVALMADAITAIATAAADTPSEAATGQHIADRITDIEFQGSTGYINFNEDGFRYNYTAYINVFNGIDTTSIGQWHSENELDSHKSGLHIENMFKHVPIPEPFSLKGKHVRAVLILEAPFAFLKKSPGPDGRPLEGNARFEGFSVDLIDALAERLEFTYELYPVPDGKFGEVMENGEWNGVIGEILNGNATLSVAPLSINTEREIAVDFTKPFRVRHIMVLMQTPEGTSGYFQFMNPLSYSVWICISLAVVLCSAALWVLEKYSQSVNKAMPKLNANESAWFVFGAVVGSGSETSPVTVPGRILTSAWWFFALILTSTYTANLAAFLTVKKINAPISSVQDLIEQSQVVYGTVRDSGVANFLKNTKIDPFDRMWAQMSEIMPDAMVASSDEGIQRVKDGDYAFLWDDSVTSYIASIDCDVTEIGPPFDPKGLGVAVPPGALYLEELSLGILHLGDNGKLMELEQKWWATYDQTADKCPDVLEAADETTELQLDNVAGLFFVLIVGAFLAFIACVMDYMFHRHRRGSKGVSSDDHSDKL